MSPFDTRTRPTRGKFQRRIRKLKVGRQMIIVNSRAFYPWDKNRFRNDLSETDELQSLVAIMKISRTSVNPRGLGNS